MDGLSHASGSLAQNLPSALHDSRGPQPLNIRGYSCSEAPPCGIELVGRSLEGVRAVLRELIRTPVNFLLVAPTGGGKDQFARAFHRASSRSGKPFVVVNCAAIPDSLFESQLFGYRKAAFTGAVDDRAGILEAAEGGFVLLNEITDAPLPVQAKLLQAIEDKVIWRVGDPSPRRIDVWIAAATNRTDMMALCDNGQFRKDLYFRLARMVVRIPSLRDRSADIPELVEHLVRQVSAVLGRRQIGFTAAAMHVLMNHTWPGNVRELENLVHSVILTNEGSTIGEDMLPESVRQKPIRSRRMAITREILRRKLAAEAWNVTRTAASMGVSRAHIHALMRRHKVARPARNHAQPRGHQLDTTQL